ncbi:uncharacterized protein PITG_03726 [Phytophthora infestans T30-4]|uniref:Uncharacterized protein n=1 Tax=Phytophthora infestans (strain T30-4) TaxID=403677 RepID=D0MYC7_PHYIT|nr:uncharacterized protein PITG_03726 [Phytophthora infestans T30-4]EEY66175.1 conserved hypothetical protein [Phytophthora infestans T30-4]|eukprot:XP_002906774.1 conserved hypothetical protein [Phytophthora infestans T30-4]
MTHLSRNSGASLDILESKVEPPQRHSKALQLWALGIGAVISGEYCGWQSSLVAGFTGMLIVMGMMAVLYVTLSFSGLAETLKVIAVNSSTFYTIYSYLQTLFNASFRMQACSTKLCVLLQLIMFFSAIPHLSYSRWVLPLASDETIEPEKSIPRGLLLCISTLVVLLRFTALVQPQPSSSE